MPSKNQITEIIEYYGVSEEVAKLLILKLGEEAVSTCLETGFYSKLTRGLSSIQALASEMDKVGVDTTFGAIEHFKEVEPDKNPVDAAISFFLGKGL